MKEIIELTFWVVAISLVVGFLRNMSVDEEFEKHLTHKIKRLLLRRITGAKVNKNFCLADFNLARRVWLDSFARNKQLVVLKIPGMDATSVSSTIQRKFPKAERDDSVKKFLLRYSPCFGANSRFVTKFRKKLCMVSIIRDNDDYIIVVE